MRQGPQKLKDKRTHSNCCGAPVNNILSKMNMGKKQWEPIENKTNGYRPCICKSINHSPQVNISEFNNYVTTTTETTTDVSTYTFTYLEPVYSNNGLINEVVDIAQNVTDANIKEVTDVTEIVKDVPIDEKTNVDIVELNHVKPNASPKIVTDKLIDVANEVTFFDIDQINYQVTETVTDRVIGIITEKDIHVVIDEVNTEEGVDLTIHSGITTTEKNASPEQPAVKFRHVGDFQEAYDTLEQSETKIDNNNNSDYDYVPDDRALQELVSYVYLKKHKTKDDVEPLKSTSIERKKINNINTVGQIKKAAIAKAPTLATKKVSAEVVNKALTIKPKSEKYQTKNPRPEAKTATQKKSGTISKPNKSEYEIKYYRTNDLDNTGLETNREIADGISSDNSYFQNMPFHYLGYERKFKGQHTL